MFKILQFSAFVLISALVSLNNIFSTERINSQDGESAVKKIVFTYNNTQYRLVSTANCLYASKYNGTNWLKANLLYTTQSGKRITDFTIASGSSNSQKNIFLLINDGVVISYSFNISTMAIDGGPLEIPPTNITTFQMTKIIVSDSIELLNGGLIYSNTKNGLGWNIDSSGMYMINIIDISLNQNGDVLASTNRGIYKKTKGTNQWHVLPGTSNQAYGSLFCDRRGNIYSTVSQVMIIASSDNGQSWFADTLGLGTGIVNRLGDDAFGSIYAVVRKNGVTSLYKMKDASGWFKTDVELIDYLGRQPVITDIGGDSTLEVATNYGMFSSKDLGSSWVESSKGITSEQIYSYLNLKSSRTIASTPLGIFKSDNGGVDWIKVYPVNSYLGTRIIYKDDSDNLYTQASSTSTTEQPPILMSSDHGDTWTLDTLGLYSIPYSAQNPGTFYADNSGQHFGFNSTAGGTIMVYSKMPSSSWHIDTTGANLGPAWGGAMQYFLSFGSDSKTKCYFSSADYSSQLGFTMPVVNSRSISGGNWSIDTTGLNYTPIVTYGTDNNGLTYLGSPALNTSSVFYKENNIWKPIIMPPASVADIKTIAFDSKNNMFLNFTGIINTNVFKGVYSTSDKGVSWSYSGLDSVNVRGLIPIGSDMYAYTSKGIYKLSSKAMKFPKISISPRSIDFDSVSYLSYKDTSITITNSGQDTLRITNFYCPNSAFTCLSNSVNIAPGNHDYVVIRFRPNVNGLTRGTMWLISNDFPDTINFQGKCINFKYPNLRVENENFDFGSAPVGSIKDSVVKIYNSGDDTLRITNITSSSPSFSVTTTRFNVPPMDSSYISIEFKPGATIQSSSLIRIFSNTADYSFRVLGVGKPTGVDDNLAVMPDFEIIPNPVETSSILHLSLETQGELKIYLYDAIGNSILEFDKGSYSIGKYQIPLDFGAKSNSTIPMGIYYIKITINNYSRVKPVVILK